MAADWSRDEVEAIVADYFAMLRAELSERPYSKTTHRRALAPRLNRRSDPSIEFEHANVSAVLVAYGLPYIDGYKPRGRNRLVRSSFSKSSAEGCTMTRGDPIWPLALNGRLR